MKHFILLISVLFVTALIILFAQESTEVGTAANSKPEKPQDTVVAKQPTKKADTLKDNNSITSVMSKSNGDTHIVYSDSMPISPKNTGDYTNDTINLSGDSTKTIKKIFIVNTAKCIGCRLCINVCPTKAITIVEGKALIDPEKCIGCGECQKVCPTKAIYEKGKE